MRRRVPKVVAEAGRVERPRVARVVVDAAVGQPVQVRVDDRMLDAAWQRAFRRANNLRADANVHTGGSPAVNVSFGNGPKYAGLCNTCAHNPSNGGGGEIAEE